MKKEIKIDPERCSITISEPPWHTHHRQCSRKGIIKRDGKLFCKQHDPKKREERYKKQDAKYQAEAAERRRKDICFAACEGISNEALEGGVVGEMRKGLERFVKWNKDYPSSRIFSHTAIVKIAAELDEICEQVEALLTKATGGE